MFGRGTRWSEYELARSLTDGFVQHSGIGNAASMHETIFFRLNDRRDRTHFTHCTLHVPDADIIAGFHSLPYIIASQDASNHIPSAKTE